MSRKVRSRKGLFPRRRMFTGALLAAIGYGSLTRMHGDALVDVPLIAAGVLLVVVPPIWWYFRSRYGIRAMKSRAARRSDRNLGFVSWSIRFTQSSGFAMRRLWARSLRRDLFNPPGRGIVRWVRMWILLFRVSVYEYAVNLGRDNFGRLWVALNSVIVRIGAARTGKTVAMADRLNRHRGPVLVASTRKDIVVLTARARDKVGNLYLFNPGNVAGFASNLKLSVLDGCKDMDVAQRHAEQLVGTAAENDERQYWNDRGIGILAPMMFAAAHAGLSMRVIARWVAATGDRARAAHAEIVDILNSTVGRAQIELMDQFFGMVGAGDRTRLSITNTLANALSWLGNPRVAALGDAQGEDLFDIKRDLLQTNATIYILGAEQRSTSALTGYLISEIVHQATEYAETLPSGRLAPAMLVMLDELASTVPGQPVPLWTTKLGGSGICMDLGVQSRSLLDDVWGVSGRRTILGQASAVLVGAGMNDAQELRDFELMSGSRDVAQRDAKGHVMKDAPMREVPVVSVQDLKELTIGNAIAYLRGPVTKIRTPNAERNRAVRKAAPWTPPATVETNYEEEARTQLNEEV